MFLSRSIVCFACLCLRAHVLYAQFTGSEACRPCHAARFEAQSKTGHARALARTRTDSPGQWAFGAGVKAITWVSQADRDTWAEHGLSYYASTKSTGITPGHESAGEVRYRTFDSDATVLKCFRCHSTGPVTLGANYSIQPGEPGIHCETCHGPGAEHVNSRGRAGTLINPARLSAAALNDFCGVCHRNAPESDWTDKWKTRHQPSYLSQSACFRNSSGALTCLTCHDPHGPLNEVAAHYDKRCLECHKAFRHTLAIAAGRACVDCHMPQVAVSAQLKFANHWIGIYSAGSAPLVPSRSGVKKIGPPTPVDRKVVSPADPSTLRPLFEQAVADVPLADAPQIAQRSFDLGLFLNSIGDAPAAETALRRAYEIARRDDAPHLAEDAENLAEILASSGRKAEALPLFQQAGTGTNPKVAALALSNLATLETERAEDHYRGAIEAEKRAENPDPKRIAILLNNLALALEQKKDYQGAESLLRNALTRQSAESPAAASTMNNLGSLLETEGRHQQAEIFERRAMRILEQKLGPWNSELATSCTNLADILWTKGDRASAADLYRRALVIDESVYGPENPEVAGDLVNYGTLLKETGQARTADQMLRRALGIFEKALGPASPEAIRVRQILR
jgi:tetratricopeptide (TPR) repeat protein